MFRDLELSEARPEPGLLRSGRKLSCAAAVAGLTAGLIYYLTGASKAAPQLAALVAESIAKSGVENPVTAVLLNFRSYDTLLEVGVLVIVAVAMLPTSQRGQQAFSPKLLEVDTNMVLDPVLDGLLRWLVPFAIITGGYLLWTGAYAPGGAFQAGAMIAGAGVALSLTARYRFAWVSTHARLLLGAGLAVFVLAGGLSMYFTGTYLAYPQQYAGLLILVIEVAATASIAAILLLLFNGVQPPPVTRSVPSPQTLPCNRTLPTTKINQVEES